MTRFEKPILSIVIPAYNEQEVLPVFHDRLIQSLLGQPYTLEVIYVNDGSTDGTFAVMTDLYSKEECVALINLSRNFGKEIAMQPA